MPELSEDLRSYFDELVARMDLDAPPAGDPPLQPESRRRSSRSWVLVPLLIGLVLIVTISGAVLATRRSSNAPLEVGGSTTSSASAETSGWIQVSVVPASGLLDGATVAVHATGFASGQMIAVVTCSGALADPGHGSADCDLETLWQGPADADGVLDAAYTVRRLIRVAGAYDCGTEPRGCRIAVGPALQSPSGAVGAAVAISFAEGPAAPLPTISMSPSTDLHDGQTVTITGANFAPDIDVSVMECPPNTDCGGEPFGVTVHTDAAGGFRQPLTLRRRFVVSANPGNGATTAPLDCTTGCTINAAEAGPASNLTADPLPFTLAP